MEPKFIKWLIIAYFGLMGSILLGVVIDQGFAYAKFKTCIENVKDMEKCKDVRH